MSDLTLPAALARPKSTQPVHLKLANLTRRRWKMRLRGGRPPGERWATAELREVYFYDEVPKFGCGYRRVWVAEGRRWCKLACTDGSTAKITMAVWAQIARRKLK